MDATEKHAMPLNLDHRNRTFVPLDAGDVLVVDGAAIQIEEAIGTAGFPYSVGDTMYLTDGGKKIVAFGRYAGDEATMRERVQEYVDRVRKMITIFGASATYTVRRGPWTAVPRDEQRRRTDALELAIADARGGHRARLEEELALIRKYCLVDKAARRSDGRDGREGREGREGRDAREEREERKERGDRRVEELEDELRRTKDKLRTCRRDRDDRDERREIAAAGAQAIEAITSLTPRRKRTRSRSGRSGRSRSRGGGRGKWRRGRRRSGRHG